LIKTTETGTQGLQEAQHGFEMLKEAKVPQLNALIMRNEVNNCAWHQCASEVTIASGIFAYNLRNRLQEKLSQGGFPQFQHRSCDLGET